MSEELEKLAYEAALRRLDKQEGHLEELRTRAGALLATSALVASLLGQQAFQDPRPRVFAVVALIAFVVATSACVFVLHPKRDLIVASESNAVYETLYIADDLTEAYGQLVYNLDRHWESNNKRAERLLRAFIVATGSFLLQTLSLAVLLSDAILLR